MELYDLLMMQDDLQRACMGGSPTQLEGEERIEFIRWNVLALEDELHEMLQEVGWKPWATSRHVNVEPALAEMVDALHFFLNILLALGRPDVSGLRDFAGLFSAEYARKNLENARRQEEGYDGVSSKCPSCKRELPKLAYVGGPMCPCGWGPDQ